MAYKELWWLQRVLWCLYLSTDLCSGFRKLPMPGKESQKGIVNLYVSSILKICPSPTDYNAKPSYIWNSCAVGWIVYLRKFCWSPNLWFCESELIWTWGLCRFSKILNEVILYWCPYKKRGDTETNTHREENVLWGQRHAEGKTSKGQWRERLEFVAAS